MDIEKLGSLKLRVSEENQPHVQLEHGHLGAWVRNYAALEVKEGDESRLFR